jgi:hypothetical protein
LLADSYLAEGNGFSSSSRHSASEIWQQESAFFVATIDAANYCVECCMVIDLQGLTIAQLPAPWGEIPSEQPHFV